MTVLTDVTNLTTVTSLSLLFHAGCDVFSVFNFYAEVSDKILLWIFDNWRNANTSLE